MAKTSTARNPCLSNRIRFVNLESVVGFIDISLRQLTALHELHRPRERAGIEQPFISLELLDKATIGLPPHPLWLWRHMPFLRVKIADQAHLDPFHAEVGPIHRRHELRSVSDVAWPGMPARKLLRPSRQPQDRCAPVQHRAHEEPLSTAIMARERGESYQLIELTNLNAKPAVKLTCHVGAEPSARYHVAVAVDPPDRLGTRLRAGGNQSSPYQQVDVELQALLKAQSLPGSRHCHPSISS